MGSKSGVKVVRRETDGRENHLQSRRVEFTESMGVRDGQK